MNCPSCGDKYSVAFQNYCENCGLELSGLQRPLSHSWSPEHQLAAPLNWLAQAHRRIRFPLEESDGTGFRGLEYVWKAFNNIYRSHFPELGDAAAWRQLARMLVSKSCFDEPQVSPHFFINKFNKLKLSSWPILPRSLRQLEPVGLHKTVFCRFSPIDQALYK